MSTGSDLLRRLRKQARPVPTHHRRENGGGGSELSPARLAVAGSSAGSGTTSSTSAAKTATTTIEVCLGPDCSGSGGGAALLEIEELVSRRATSNENETVSVGTSAVVVIPGGCRDFCTMGPNVHVAHTAGSNRGDVHRTRVDGPEACRAVVASALGAGAPPVAGGGAAALLRRREDGIRWRSHRERAARDRRLRVRKRSTKAKIGR